MHLGILTGGGDVPGLNPAIKAPESFIDDVLWPEFSELNAALVAYLADVTDRIIRDEVYRDLDEPDEVAR